MSYDEMIQTSANKISWQVAQDIQDRLYQQVKNGQLKFTPEAISKKAKELVGYENAEILQLNTSAYFEILKRRFSLPD